MQQNYTNLPENLPVPEDDGAAAHLAGMCFPDIALTATDGMSVKLSGKPGRVVLYLYPMTGQPGVPLPDGWDAIPGARGCTPQSCSFRDHYVELQSLGCEVYGISTQQSAYQQEARQRLHLPFELLSDNGLQLKALLRLPTFEVAGMELYKRMALVLEEGVIIKVFYPVFPPDKNAEEVLNWLKSR